MDDLEYDAPQHHHPEDDLYDLPDDPALEDELRLLNLIQSGFVTQRSTGRYVLAAEELRVFMARINGDTLDTPVSDDELDRRIREQTREE